MIIIVSGTIGVGKTTICRKLVELIRDEGFTTGGVLTYKAADEGIIIEDIGSGKTETLASTSTEYQGPRTPKYSFNPEGIFLGIRAIDRVASAAVLVVDEIGHLELRGEGFVRVIDLLKAGKVKDCILVIRKELLSAFLPQLPANPLVFETTIDNRNLLPQEIGSVLFKKLR